MGVPALLRLLIDNTSIVFQQEYKSQKQYQKMLMASLSHEFKTPLNAILFHLGILLETSKDKEGMRHLEVIQSQVILLTFLIDDVIDYQSFEQ